MQPDMPVETALRVYRRYLKLEPSHTEEYIAYLKSKVAEAGGHVHSLQAFCPSFLMLPPLVV